MKVLALPYRLEAVPDPVLGKIGIAVGTFASAKDAANFFQRYPNAATPCWQRMEVIDGELVQVR
ncbi:MAG TPA: hypothetical protein PKV97_01845 [Thauera aminoaromatica]|nr:hypothetical protein [Thauera aminoaromatica]